MTRQDILAGKAVLVFEARNLVSGTLNHLRSEIRRFALDAARIGSALLIPGVGLSFGLARFQQVFTEFDDGLRVLRTKFTEFKGDLSLLNIQPLIDQIRDLGRNTFATAREVTQAATELAKAGFSMAATQQSLRATLDLARGGQISLQESATTLADVIETYSLPKSSSSANRVASLLVTTADNATTSVELLKESLKEVSGTLRTVNADLPTSLALIATLASRSLKGTKAGTSLNTAILNLVKNSDKLKESFGVNPLDAQGNQRNLIEILTEIRDASRKFGSGELIGEIQDFANIRGGRAITGLLPQIEKIVERYEQLIKVSDEARRNSDLIEGGIGGAVRRINAAFEGLKIDIFRSQEESIKSFLDSVAALVTGVGLLVQQYTKISLVALSLPPALLATGTAIFAMSPILLTIAAALKPVIFLFEKLTNIVKRTAATNAAIFGTFSVAKPIKESIKELQVSRKELKTQFSGYRKDVATEIKALKKLTIVELIGIFGVALPQARQARDAQVASIKAGLKAQSDAFKVADATLKAQIAARQATLNTFLKGSPAASAKVAFQEGRGGLIGGAIAGLKAVPNVFKGQTLPSLTKFKTFLTNIPLFLNRKILKTGFLTLTNNIRLAISNGFSLIGILAKVGNALLKIGSIIKFAFTANGALLFAEIAFAARKSVPIFGQFFDTFTNAFSGLGKVIRDDIIPDFRRIGEVISTFLSILSSGRQDDAIEFLKNQIGDIVSLISVDLRKAGNEVSLAFQPITDVLKETFGLVTDIIGGLVKIGGTILSQVSSALGETVRDLFGKGKEPFKLEDLSQFISAVRTVTNLILDTINTAIEGALTAIGTVLNLITTAFGAITRGVVTVLSLVVKTTGKGGSLLSFDGREGLSKSQAERSAEAYRKQGFAVQATAVDSMFARGLGVNNGFTVSQPSFFKEYNDALKENKKAFDGLGMTIKEINGSFKQIQLGKALNEEANQLRQNIAVRNAQRAKEAFTIKLLQDAFKGTRDSLGIQKSEFSPSEITSLLDPSRVSSVYSESFGAALKRIQQQAFAEQRLDQFAKGQNFPNAVKEFLDTITGELRRVNPNSIPGLPSTALPTSRINNVIPSLLSQEDRAALQIGDREKTGFFGTSEIETQNFFALQLTKIQDAIKALDLGVDLPGDDKFTRMQEQSLEKGLKDGVRKAIEDAIRSSGDNLAPFMEDAIDLLINSSQQSIQSIEYTRAAVFRADQARQNFLQAPTAGVEQKLDTLNTTLSPDTIDEIKDLLREIRNAAGA